jgi:hypothetical protein
MIHLLPSLNNNLKQQTQPCKSPQESLTYQNPGKDKERKKERKRTTKFTKDFPWVQRKKYHLICNKYQLTHTESIKNFEKIGEYLRACSRTFP